MKERPILFKGQMIRAILAGKKTQTRRLVKGLALDWIEREGFTPEFVASPENGMCPYGQPGDRLWVRETHQFFCAEDCDGPNYQDLKTGKGLKVSYTATDGVQEFIDWDDNITSACRPSIHMPRWASRITLEITDVRVERLQDISEVDAIAEGLMYHNDVYGYALYGDYSGMGPTDKVGPIQSFISLWHSINGFDSWNANPWVWVIELKKIKMVR